MVSQREVFVSPCPLFPPRFAMAAEAPAEPPAKRAKKEGCAYRMNINLAVDKAYEGSSFLELCDAPVTALQGVSDRGQEVLVKLKVVTIRDLGTWKFYRIAKAINGLAPKEEEGKREEAAKLNINSAINVKYETASLCDIADLPPSALQGLASWVDEELEVLGVGTIGKLGSWKFAQWAEYIVDLAAFENADFGSR